MKRDKDALHTHLKSLFDKRGYSGMAVCIRGPEGVIYEEGFGFRNEEQDLPVDGNTIFGIASMSKSMTALACCILHAEGKLSLDDPITKYFPKLHIAGAPDECVTLKTVAMHRTGLPPLPPLEWSISLNSKEEDSPWHRYMMKTAPNKMETIDQLVDYLAEGDFEPLGPPGEYMSYSNDGYALLSYVVDMAAGMTLEEFLDQRIFKPLGMERSVLDEDCSQAKAMAGGNITSLFEKDFETGQLYCDDDWSVLPPFRGCACVKSTAEDMSRYYKMLADGGVWEGRQVIPAEAVELMVGREFPLRRQPYYCMGLNKCRIADQAVCYHTGGLHGVSSIGGFTESGYSAVVLCNMGDVEVEEFQWVCYNYIMGLPLDTTHRWAEPNGENFSMPEALCGDFLSKEGMPAHTIVTWEDGQLKADYNGRKTLLRYCGGLVFAAVSEADPSKRISTFQFFLRDGKAQMVRCYNRIYQKV